MTDKTIVETVEASGETAALVSAALGGGSIPERVLLAPWGEVESAHGSFVVDEQAARMVIEAFERHGTDLPIDYEHQTLGGAYASPSGQAPAAGWIRKLTAEPGVGLLADIAWTPQAAEHLAAREYRYLSPVALVRKADRRVSAIHSAALTNKPAIRGMQPIINRDAPAESATPMTHLCTLLKIAPESDIDTVLLAAGERLEHWQASVRRREAEVKVEDVLRSGRLTEAQKGWAVEMALNHPLLFEDWLRHAPVVVGLGRLAAPKGGDAVQGPMAARARGEYRTNALLNQLTSEEAFIADALRRA